MRLVPTCDDAERPMLKAAIHGATAALYLLMVVYHLQAVGLHLWDRWTHTSTLLDYHRPAGRGECDGY